MWSSCQACQVFDHRHPNRTVTVRLYSKKRALNRRLNCVVMCTKSGPNSHSRESVTNHLTLLGLRGILKSSIQIQRVLPTYIHPRPPWINPAYRIWLCPSLAAQIRLTGRAAKVLQEGPNTLVGVVPMNSRLDDFRLSEYDWL